MNTGYHGTEGQATIHVGFCYTDSERAAERYAEGNCGHTVTEVHVDIDGLTVVEVEYDFDDCEPIIPEDCTADIVTYLDSDEHGHDHDTAMLLTEAAVAATTIIGTHEI